MSGSCDGVRTSTIELLFVDIDGGEGTLNVQTVQIAQMATLDADQLKIILPTEESFPRWISFTEYEKVVTLMAQGFSFLSEVVGAVIGPQGLIVKCCGTSYCKVQPSACRVRGVEYLIE